MKILVKNVIRWGSYPIIFGSCAAMQLYIANSSLPYWPFSPIVVMAGIIFVALLERIEPYENEWLEDHDDTLVDVFHAFASLTLIFTSMEIVAITKIWLPTMGVWPNDWAVWLQVACAALFIDLGLWVMHWLSHKNGFLWRLHALHHSSERLYWLNGERRHPLSALALALPGIVVVVILGAPPFIIACWLSIVAVHLSFQHANLDYSVGPFRKLLAVAEVHRWHHKREYKDAQVNYGEFFVIWDHIFGTYRHQVNGVRAGEVGMDEETPLKYFDQIKWPFLNK